MRGGKKSGIVQKTVVVFRAQTASNGLGGLKHTTSNPPGTVCLEHEAVVPRP